jgi:hypothetical protein
MLALSIGVTAVLLGALSVTHEVAGRGEQSAARQQKLICAMAYVLLAIAFAAKATGKLPA